MRARDKQQSQRGRSGRHVPRLAGNSLVIVAAALENPISGGLIRPRLMRDAGIEQLRNKVFDEPPSVTPPLAYPPAVTASSSGPPPDLDAVIRGAVDSRGFRFESIADYVRAYREGRSDPEKVAERLLAAIGSFDQGQTPLRAITAFRADEVMSQANVSAERHRRGKPLSPLDGVPVAVKEEFDVAGYATTVSTAGAFPLCWSVAHAGPIGVTARDVAIGYAVMAGLGAYEPNAPKQPPVRLDGLGRRDLTGIRLGVFTPWFEDAHPDVVSICRGMLERLRGHGADVVEVEIPNLGLAQLAHAVTILCEMATAMDAYDARHRRDLGAGVRLRLGLARAFTGRDYVRAQQVRTQCSRNFENALAHCDALVSPTSAIVAPAVRSDALRHGECDLDMTSAIMRFVFPSNLTGHPAITVPAGYDSAGLPVGLQAIGQPWEEHLLLRLAEVCEMTLERRSPKVHSRLLADGAVTRASRKQGNPDDLAGKEACI